MHYYQRWAENDASRTAARKEAEAASQQQLLQLSEATATPVSQLKFICDAWDQVGTSPCSLILNCATLAISVPCHLLYRQQGYRTYQNQIPSL